MSNQDGKRTLEIPRAQNEDSWILSDKWTGSQWLPQRSSPIPDNFDHYIECNAHRGLRQDFRFAKSEQWNRKVA